MVEGGRLGRGRGVHEHELVSAFDGFPVPEFRRRPDPCGLFDDVDGQALEFFAEFVGPVVVSPGPLGGEDGGKDEQDEKKKDDDAAMGGVHDALHGN